MNTLSETLVPPYYAAILKPVDGEFDRRGLVALEEMISLAPRLKGFLGLETARLDDGSGATVCYWKTSDAISEWKTKVLRKLIAELNLRHRRIEDACAINVTRVSKSFFGKRTPLGITEIPDVADDWAQPRRVA